MIAIAASFAFALVAAPQQACASHDTDCRIRQLEQRVQALERRLAQPPRNGIEMAVNFTCSNQAECVRRAVQACAQGGFTRGAPIDPEPLYSFFTVQRVACAG